jgi:hypothetical protein
MSLPVVCKFAAKGNFAEDSIATAIEKYRLLRIPTVERAVWIKSKQLFVSTHRI